MVGPIQSAVAINGWRTSDLATILEWDCTIPLQQNRFVMIDCVDVAGDSELLEFETGAAGGEHLLVCI
jgi:hypothetical protein